MQGESTLTGVGDGEAVCRLDVVHMRHQVEGRFRGIRAGVVQKDGQAKGSVLLIRVSDEQATWGGRKHCWMSGLGKTLVLATWRLMTCRAFGLFGEIG